MATVMEMPKLSDTMKEGAIARWLKKEGEKIQAGLPVVEIETDKATMEFESPASGTILKIIVGDKQTCALNAPIAVIGKPEENWQEALDKYNAKKGGGAAAPAKTAAPTAPAASANKPAAAASASAAPAAQASSGDGRIKASPLAKKVASDMGVDLRGMQGSGPNGRVIIRDLENVSAQSPSSAAPSRDNKTIPLSMMRKTIARRLTESVNQAPHFYLTVNFNVSDLLNWRKQAVAKLPEDKKFSVNDLLIAIVARALRKHPNINASWQGDSIVEYGAVHLAFAVALPTGLVTPVLRNADTMDIYSIAKKSKEMIKLAREGKLQPQDYEGGTFTISNLGMNGIEEFTAIINPPQAAILAIGASIPTPVVNDEGDVVVETRMKLTMSCDHRVIDGFGGSEFLKTLRTYIEDPLTALLT